MAHGKSHILEDSECQPRPWLHHHPRSDEGGVREGAAAEVSRLRCSMVVLHFGRFPLACGQWLEEIQSGLRLG